MKVNVTTDTPQWDRNVNSAVMAHITTYHQSIKCTPTEFFNGRIQHNALDLQFSSPLKTRCTKTDLTTLVDKVNQKYKEKVSEIFEAFNKYKNYYDQDAQAQPLKVG